MAFCSTKLNRNPPASHMKGRRLLNKATILFVQVGLLLEKGSSVDCDIQVYSSPLIEAAKNGHYHIVNRLLQDGADVNRYDTKVFKKKLN